MCRFLADFSRKFHTNKEKFATKLKTISMVVCVCVRKRGRNTTEKNQQQHKNNSKETEMPVSFSVCA